LLEVALPAIMVCLSNNDEDEDADLAHHGTVLVTLLLLSFS
jgi:hypothetical protein